ncbi:L-threonylcarbamoyladenylate synthase [Acidiferrimicrobium sp. IK]|uniref:L-threonylcarbamoyladenylate synthase n=1 Tax=Acidiferrimicrobium sp. IK TaxID=2871700 RepID=UPI0021CAFE3F|nr:L-threonylcarbamoyladenylate synthase [Acidiferrimicrobium sp. IK]MCU4186324.1 L-threonylcarbamoyladenylate synthase [Acidiferrimicrobium sp. IK]
MTQVREESPSALREAAAVLRSGGMVVVPSRTNYALVCDYEDPRSIANVFEAKKRSKFGPLTLAIPRISDLEDYVWTVPDFGAAHAEAIWPAEVSFIFAQRRRLPPRMTMGATTVAVMFQRECALRRLLDTYQRPLALTSANLSGQGNITVTREKALEDVGGVVDFFLYNDRVDEVVDTKAQGVQPSNTIVDFTFDAPYLVRPGAYPVEKLRPWIPGLIEDPAAYQALLAARLEAARVTAE